MSAAIFLHWGPVASGKTSALLNRYRERSAAGIGTALWLAPTERARDALRPRLVGPHGVCIAPNVYTFPDFARQVVFAAEPSAQALPELHQRLLLDDILADLCRRGELPYFAAVADHRGFSDAVFALLTELKGQGIGPIEFKALTAQLADADAAPRGSGKLRAKDHQVALIFDRYQKRLHQQRLLDREATYARTRDLWTTGRRGPFAAVRAVFADGFADFTPPQIELLNCIAETVDEVWISILGDRANDDSRGELFSRTSATLARLQRLAVDKAFLIRTDAEPPTQPARRPAGLAHLEASIFRAAEAVTPAADAAGMSIVEAPGLLGEIRLVARAIKALLLDGTAADDIVVTARDLAPYADLVCEVFAQYGVPLDLEGSDPLTRNPAIATLLRAGRLSDDGFPFAGTTALLRSGYFRPDWPEVADPAVAEHAEALLRLLGEPRGRDAYLRALRLWAVEPPPGLEDERAEASRRQRKHRLARRCQAFLERFFRAWDDMPHHAELARHGEWLRRFADDLGLSREAERTDALAWRRFWTELDGWAAHESSPHRDVPRHSRSAFGRLLNTIAASVGVPRTPRGPGRVRVVAAEQARHLDCDYLVILGLGERSFPNLGASEPLYDDAERQALRQAGLDVRCAADQLPEEMLLFYQLVTRPRRRLVLSYPAVDAKGQPLLPSSFLTAAVECFHAGTVPVERQRMLIEGFDRLRPLSPAEYRVRWALAGGEGSSADLFAHLRAAAEIARQRFRTRDFSPYDGLLRHPDILADVGQRFGPDKVLSPTALERYVDCPFRFFLDQVLGLEPLDQPGDEVEHTRRGAAVHRALARLHQGLKTDEVHTPSDALDQQFSNELTTAIEEYVARVASPVGQTLWRLEGQRLQRAVARYRLHWEKFQKPWRDHALALRPHLFEVEFGLNTDSQTEPLVIRVEGVEVRVGGRIDRIDVTELADGGLGYWVIDYKTGRSTYYGGADLVAMRRLQLTLYALAAERVLLADARPLGMAYWMVADTGPKLALPPGRSATAWLTAAEQWPKFRSQLEAWVVKLVGHIRRGTFPLKPRSEDCTETCPYGQICRIAQSRAVEKDWKLPLPSESTD